MALVAGVAMLGSASTAFAIPPWLTPVDLAAPVAGFTFQNAVAVAPDGTTYVVYTRYDGANDRVYATKTSPRTGFEAPVALSDAGQSASSPSVAVDRQGNATVVWNRGGQVQASYRRAVSTWEPYQVLGNSTNYEPDIAVGDNGAAVASWSVLDAGKARIQVATRAAGASTFAGSPAFVSDAAGAAFQSRVAMDAAGDVAVIWSRYYNPGGGDRYVMQATTKAVGAAFPNPPASPTLLSPTFGAAGSTATYNSFDVKMTPGGRAIAIWTYYTDGTTHSIDFSERAPGATFATPVAFAATKTLSAPGVTSDTPKIAIDDGGGAVATWAANGTVQSAVRGNPDAAFSTPKALSGAGAAATSAAIASAPNGEAVIVWPITSGPDRGIVSSRRPAGTSSFGDPIEVLRTPGIAIGYTSLAAGLDGEGNGYSSWTKADLSAPTYAPQAVGFDPVAPVLGAVTVPATAVAGTSASGFSATATDRMSNVELAWDFGDGTATGATPVHTFAGAGTYTVKLTATDGAGNRTETSRLVQVAAAASPSVPPVPPSPTTPTKPPVPPASPIALRTVPAVTTLGWDRLRSGRTKIKALKVERLAKGDVVSLRCTTRKRGCRKGATRKATATSGGRVVFTKYVKGMKLAPKAALVVKVTRKNAISRITTFTMAGKKPPVTRERCQAPGASGTTRCG